MLLEVWKALSFRNFYRDSRAYGTDISVWKILLTYPKYCYWILFTQKYKQLI